jgi:hypothetical protein
MGNALAYESPGMSVLKQRVDFPDLVANPGKVALASAPTVGLTSFAGLDGTAGDVLQVFALPAGTLITQMGLSVVTADSLTGTIALGDGSSTAGWGAAKICNAVDSQITLVTDAFGADNVMGKFYAAKDTLDMLSATALIAEAVIDVWAIAFKVNGV